MNSYFSATLFLVAQASAMTAGAQSLPISQAPYPGTLSVSVDATDNLDHIDSVRIDYRGGLRYPHLQRVAATPDRLAAILAERK